MTSKEKWFHGTPHEFDKFDTKYIGVGNDELGSGFYFSNDIDTAKCYADGDGYIIEVDINIQKPLMDDTYFSKDEIRKILQGSPDLEDNLWNFGDLSREPQEKVLNKAVDIYYDMNHGDDAVKLLYTISNDFWSGHEAEFLDHVTNVTGYDGLYRERGNQVHAVVWNPSKISIKEVTQVMTEQFKP